MRWPKHWSFSFSISPSNEHPGLTSLRMDWLDLLAVQGTLKSLLQHHSSKASIFQHSAFFAVQLSHLYMTMGKTLAFTRRTHSTLCKMPGWIKHKLESRLLEDTTLMAESEEQQKSLLLKEESEKVGLNSTFKNLRSWHQVP